MLVTMRSVDEVQEAIDSVLTDLRHLDEMRSMRTMNQGYSEIRNRLLGEIERLLNEKRETLQWVLSGE